jgi:large subunit ribosomal protein L21
MKKAVITTGSKQYIVAEGDTIEVELLDTKDKTVKFEALLVVEDSKTTVGKPTVSGAEVSASVTEADVKGDKVTAIRYKAKKRVHKVHGHRQHHAILKITQIKTK